MTTGDVLVIDGGMGHLLRRNGIKIEGKVGTMERFVSVALSNVSQPELVRRSHQEYIDAGARAVTTNSYACVPAAIGDDRTEEGVKAAGAVAAEAAQATPEGDRTLVLGCVPPLHESYGVDKVGSDEELARDYATICAAIAPYADVLLCETMSTAREAFFASQAARKTGKPVWVSWTLMEDDTSRLLSGETVEEAVKALGDLSTPGMGRVEACMFNCSQPDSITAAMPRLRAACPSDVRIGAYANGFKTIHQGGLGQSAQSEYRDLAPEEYADLTEMWVRCGATIVGGCCGVFPEHICAVAKRFPKTGHRVLRSGA